MSNDGVDLTDDEKLLGVSAEFYENTVLPKFPAVKIEEFGDYIKNNRDDKLDEQFEVLPEIPLKSHDCATEPKNKNKNRYRSLFPFDQNRVVLEDGQDGDYVNASHILSYDNEKRFIASQGPNKHSVSDFWEMVWQEKVQKIIMLTKIFEGDRPKCEGYWPAVAMASLTFGLIKVKTLSVEDLPDYQVTTISIKKNSENRTVMHFHFTSWPDHGVPLFAASLLQFWRKVNTWRLPGNVKVKAGSAMLIHCSAGVGRTGTLIAIDWLLSQAKKERVVHPYRCVLELRKQRHLMVQTKAQYRFLHQAVLEGCSLQDAVIPADKLGAECKRLSVMKPGATATPISEQYKKLQDISTTSLSKRETTIATNAHNLRKNRNPAIMADDEHRVLVNPCFEDDAENDIYINATFINSYRTRNAFILTQLPLPETTEHFWEMVFRHKCTTIVAVCSPSEDEQYWLKEEKPAVYGQFGVSLISCKTEELFVRRVFEVSLVNSTTTKPVKVNQFEYTGAWNETLHIPKEEEKYLTFLLHCEMSRRIKPDDKCIVHDIDGATRAGLHIMISNCIEQLVCDNEIDLCQMILRLRAAQPKAIVNQSQINAGYVLVTNYKIDHSNYANLK